MTGSRPDLGLWLLAMFVLMPPIGVYAALGIAPLLAVTAIGVVVLRPREIWPWIRGHGTLSAALAAIGLLGAASAVWSILPAHSLTEGLRFLTLSASGLVVVGAATSLAHEERNRILRWTAISTAVTVAALAIDVALGLPLLRIAIAAEPGQVIHLERFDRGTTVIGLLFWPVAFSLARERAFGLLGVLIAATVVALLMIPSSANRLAFLIAALLWLAAGYAPRLTRRAVAIATIALALALPMAVPRLLPANEAVVELNDSAPWIKYTGLHRLLIWRFVSERVAERPLLGWGMDASRELPGGHIKLADTLSRPVVPENAEALPLHPHNAFLQWWVELGAVGVALCLAVVVTLLRRIAALGPREASAATAYAVAALTIAMLGYGFWQSWWLSTLWLAGTLVTAATGARQTRRS